MVVLFLPQWADGPARPLSGSDRPHRWLAGQPAAEAHQLATDPPPHGAMLCRQLDREARAAQPRFALLNQAEQDTQVQGAVHENHLLSSFC